MPIPVPISDHNEPLPPDILTTIRFNFEWRRLVTELLWEMTDDSFWSGSQPDIEDAANKAIVMLEDLYTADIVGGDMIYEGALIGKTAAEVIGAADETIVFDDESTVPLHDIINFYDVLSPSELKVPVGSSGYYRLFAFAQVAAGSGVMVAWITVNSAKVGGMAADTNTSVHTLLLGNNVKLADGDIVELVMHNFSASRNITTTSQYPYSALLGLQRLGDPL